MFNGGAVKLIQEVDGLGGSATHNLNKVNLTKYP